MTENQSLTPSEVETQTPDSTAKPRRIAWGRVIAWTVIMAVLVIIGLRLMQVQRGPLQVGKPAPNFSLTTYDGKEVSLDSLKGKVVVVNFWASWCIPCKDEAPDLENAWRLYQNRDDVAFVGVAWTDTDKNAQAYLDEFSITYPNGPDLGTKISQKYRITGVPETYILDRDGNLAYFKFSPFSSVQEIQAAIDPLLE